MYVTRDNAEEVGRILLEENVRSVNYRYGAAGLVTMKKTRLPCIALPMPPGLCRRCNLSRLCTVLIISPAKPKIGKLLWRGGFARRLFRPPLGGCQAMRLRRGRSPIDRQMDCKRFLWKDVLKLRREQLTAARQKQPALFELQDDVRPKSQRTAAGRLGEPTLEGKALDNGT